MADDTVYTVIDTVDTNTGGPTSSDYEKNGVVTTTSPAPPDDTAYSYTDGLDRSQGTPNSSFYEAGTVYQDLVLADQTIANITAQAAAALSDRLKADADVLAFLTSPAFTGVPTAPTAAPGTNNTQVATTAYTDSSVLVETNARIAAVSSEATTRATNDTTETNARIAADSAITTAYTAADALKAPLASPALTGTPTAPTAAALNNTTQVATTAYTDAAVSVLSGTTTTALALKAPLASPGFSGTPTAPTAAALTNTTQVATTSYADAATGVEKTRALAAETLLAPLASPTFTGTPAAPTPTAGDNTTKLATTAFVSNLVNPGSWTSYTPTATTQSGALTAYTATGRYQKIGKTVIMQCDVNITTVGTGAGGLRVTLPFTAAAFNYAGASREILLTGKAGSANVIASGTTLDARDATGTTYAATGAEIVCSVMYETP